MRAVSSTGDAFDSGAFQVPPVEVAGGHFLPHRAAFVPVKVGGRGRRRGREFRALRLETAPGRWTPRTAPQTEASGAP